MTAPDRSEGAAGPVLLVSPDAELRTDLAIRIERTGRPAAESSPALMVAREVSRQRPSLVVLDEADAALDVSEVCRALKASPDPPLVLVITHGPAESVVRALDAGADEALRGPLTAAEVEVAAARLLEAGGARPRRRGRAAVAVALACIAAAGATAAAVVAGGDDEGRVADRRPAAEAPAPATPAGTPEPQAPADTPEPAAEAPEPAETPEPAAPAPAPAPPQVAVQPGDVRVSAVRLGADAGRTALAYRVDRPAYAVVQATGAGGERLGAPITAFLPAGAARQVLPGRAGDVRGLVLTLAPAEGGRPTAVTVALP